MADAQEVPRDVRGAWNETGEKLTELGRKLKVHYDEQHEVQSQESRQELTDAARKVRGALQDAFEAIGTAARDASVQSDVKKVGQSLVEALGATLGQASDEVRRVFSERKGAATTFEEPTPPPSGEPSAEPVGEPVAEPSGETGEPSATGSDEGGNPGDEGQAPRVEPWGTP